MRRCGRSKHARDKPACTLLWCWLRAYQRERPALEPESFVADERIRGRHLDPMIQLPKR